ncbi:hypothetical protein [Ignatzschineria sp. LJL83]
MMSDITILVLSQVRAPTLLALLKLFCCLLKYGICHFSGIKLQK